MINKSYFALAFLLAAAPAHAGGLTLYVGDSYTQGVSSAGAALEGLLGGPARVMRYAEVGASALYYARDQVCPRSGCPYDYSIPGHPNGHAGEPLPANFGGLAKLLGEQATKPERVIIALGTNDAQAYCTGGAGMPAVAGKLAGIAHSSGASCTWLGPISFLEGSEVYATCGERFNQYVTALKSAVEAQGCRFVDMRRAGNTQRGCPADNPNYLEKDPAKNCSLHPSARDHMHFAPDDPQIGLWARYAAGHLP